MPNSRLDTDAPHSLTTLIGRYDPAIFELRRPQARIRLDGASPRPLDAVLEGDTARLEPADPDQRTDALLSATSRPRLSQATSRRDERFSRRRLRIRQDLHLAVGLAAIRWRPSDGSLRFRHVETRIGDLSISEARSGPPVLLILGLA